MQIFLKSPGRWAGPPLSDASVAAFQAARTASAVERVVAHAGYLINLAAPDAATLTASRDALRDEMTRAARLGVDALIVHPGAHRGDGATAAIERAAETLALVLRDEATRGPVLLLENTAGTGTLLGAGWDDLAAIRRGSGYARRVDVCLDTCHAFAAGHAIDEPSGYDAFFADLDRRLGAATLRCVHVNDSQAARGSLRDRHANLGAGQLGRPFFARLAADPRFAGLPMIVETPSGTDLSGHRRDIATLTRLWLRRSP